MNFIKIYSLRGYRMFIKLSKKFDMKIGIIYLHFFECIPKITRKYFFKLIVVVTYNLKIFFYT